MPRITATITTDVPKGDYCASTATPICRHLNNYSGMCGLFSCSVGFHAIKARRCKDACKAAEEAMREADCQRDREEAPIAHA